LRRILLILLAVTLNVICSKAKAGNTLDSLQNILLHAPNDSARCVAHLELCWHYSYYQINFDKAFYHATEAKKLAEKINNQKLLGHALNEVGEVYDMKGNHLKAKEHLFIALHIFSVTHDSEWIVTVQKNLGLSNYYQGKLDSSMYWNIEALKIEDKLKNKESIADIYNNMGMSEALSDQKSKGIEFFQKSYKLYLEAEDFYSAANTMNNIGETYCDLKEYDSAIFHINKALKIATAHNIPVQIRTSWVELGFCYNALKNYNEALRYFKKVEADPETKQDIYDYINLLLGMSETYLGLKNYKKAIELSTKGISQKSVADNNYYDTFSRFYKILSESYEKVGEYTKALFFYKNYKLLSDSLLNEKNTTNMNELSAKFEFQQKQQQIDLLQKENLVKDYSIQKSKASVFLYLTALCFSALVIIALLVFYLNKRKTTRTLKEKNALISASLKERDVLLKEIHHRVKNNLQVINSLLNLQSKKMEDPTALEAIKEAKNRIKTMALIHQSLYSDKDLTNINTKEYVESLIHSLFVSYKINITEIDLITDVDSIPMEVDTLVSLGLIINELISNALKYAFENANKGRLEVNLKKTEENIILEVNDNGIGLPADWNKKTTSIGYQIINSFIKKVNGKINIDGTDGTRVQIIVNKNQKI
jgi:two-component sensor histidine kinase